MACKEKAESYLAVKQLFSPTSALLTERQKKKAPRYLPVVSDLGEIGNDWPVRQVGLEALAYGCMLCLKRLNVN